MPYSLTLSIKLTTIQINRSTPKRLCPSVFCLCSDQQLMSQKESYYSQEAEQHQTKEPQYEEELVAVAAGEVRRMTTQSPLDPTHGLNRSSHFQ